MIKPLQIEVTISATGRHLSGVRTLLCQFALSCSLLAVILAQTALAETARPGSPWDRVTTPYFRHLTLPNELPNVSTAMAQDLTGFIWIATEDGLARWDGYRSKLFRHDPEDHFSLPSNAITALLVNERGELFVAMEDGAVARFDFGTEHFIPLAPTNTGIGRYPAFVSDGRGGLWLGTSNGLSHWDAAKNTWESIAFPVHTRVASLMLARDGTLWAGTDHGLMERKTGQTEFTIPAQISSEDSLTKSNIRSLLQTRDGQIWFGTNDGRIGNISEENKPREADISHPAAAILSLAELPNGSICAGTGGTGLIVVDQITLLPIQMLTKDPMRPSGLADDFITDLMTDRSGGLWIGHARGADYLSAATGTFQSLLPSERDAAALAGSYVTTIATRLDGKLWFGTEKGSDLLSLTGGDLSLTHQPYKSGDRLPTALVHSIIALSDSQTWIGTAQGLFEENNGRLKKFAPLQDTPVRSLWADKDGLWIGTDRQGLMRLDWKSRALTSYLHDQSDPQSISDNSILGLLYDPQRGLWIGTPHGLNLFDGKSFRVFHHDPDDPASLSSEVVAGLQLDHRGRLWLGTVGGGLAMLDSGSVTPAHFRHIGRPQGMPSEDVDTMVEDNIGRIWVGTDAGMAVIDPDTLTVHGFSSADGVVITSYFPNSGVRMADGTLIFGGIGGATVVHPDRLSDWTYKPAVAVTSVRIGNRATPAAQSLVLPADDHSLQVEFSALDYSAPERNKYSYKLEGFDRDWITTDSDHRLAAYTNLPPGSYSLLLRGSNRSGVWADASTRLSIVVKPAWYQTILFKIALASAAATAVWGLVRSRTAFLRRRQKELEGQVAERTSEIASLLHNSGEGFLSFGSDLVIDRQYSRACETFLGEKPDGKNAAVLLFAENPKHVAFVTESVPTALTSQTQQKRDLILSLLPDEVDRRGRRLKLHYSILENGHLMVVLRDITTERRLAERIASEHRRLGMIVAAVIDSRDFFSTLNSFRSFISHIQVNPNAFMDAQSAFQHIYRQVHTFKGEFRQLSFEQIPAALHQAEDQLDEARREVANRGVADILGILSPDQLLLALDRDLAVVRKALGDDFIARGGRVTMTPEQASQIKELAVYCLKGERIDLRRPAVRKLLEDIEKIGTISLRDELVSFDQTIAQVALRLEKEVAPLTVTGGEDVWIDPEIYGPFLRSLIHVFRNCVTHGIESPEIRLERGKDEHGQITCAVALAGDELKIVIADDGAGIDLAALREEIVKRGYCSQEDAVRSSDDELISYIFRDHLTTAEDADQWSGRGIGLAAVRQEIEALGGTLAVRTDCGRGTSFTFCVNMRRQPAYQTA
jgi:ligand-binding sensor domain-containing protein/signal transduction histidine kinase